MVRSQRVLAMNSSSSGFFTQHCSVETSSATAKRSVASSILSAINPVANAVCVIFCGVIVAACASMPPSEAQTQAYADMVFNVLIAEFALREDDHETAASYYARTLRQSSDATFVAAAVEFFLERGDYENAVAGAEVLLELRPRDVTLKQLLPYLYLITAQPDKVIALLDSYADPQLVTDVFRKVLIVGLSGVDNAKSAALRSVAQHFRSNASAQYAYALSAAYLGHYEQAIAFADRGLTSAPDVVIGYKIKADALQKSGHTGNSLATLRSGVARLPEDISLRMAYARMLYRSGDNTEAYQQLMHLYGSAKPAPQHVVQLLGVVAMELGHNTDALQYFKELAKYPGMRLRARYFRAYALFQQRNFVDAVELLRDIPAMDNDVFERAQLLLARIYQEQMMIDQAVQQLSQAIGQAAASGQQISFYAAQGKILSAAKRHIHAREVYSAAILKFPEHLDFYLLRAYNGIALNDLAAIERDVHHILSKDAQHLDALNLLGYHLADMNIRLDEAKGYLLRAYTISPDDPRIIDSLGWIEFRLKNFAAAEGLIRQAVEQYPNPEIYGHLVEILRSRNQPLKAKKQLDEALRLYPDDEYLKSL